MFESINDNLLKHYEIPRNTLNYFNNILKIEKKPKNKVFIRPGEKSNTFFFINKGLVKSYILNDDAKEVILDIKMENEWVGDINSFSFHNPNRFYFKTLEPTELVTINYDSFMLALEKYPELESAFNSILKNELISLQDRYVQHVARNAKERYQYFVDHQSNLSQRVSQRIIASYLGITPEFLSKIRKN